MNEIDSRPLVAVLTDVRDLGRSRRDRKTDPEMVTLAKRAHAALMWMEADLAGDLDAAGRWLDTVYGRTSH